MTSSSPVPIPPSHSFSPPTAVLQCSKCLVILSDTMRYFVSSDAPSQTVTVSAAHNIAVAPNRLRAKSGPDAACCFRLTSCSNCSAPLGRFYTDATPEQVTLLNNYSFASAAIVAYQLGSIGGASSPASAAAPACAPASSAAARKSPALELSGRPACDIFEGGGAGGAGNVPEPSLVELDAHVAKLTSAANASTQAQGEMGEELRAVREEAARVKLKLSENESTLEKMQSLIIGWEERFTELERRAGLVDDRLAENERKAMRFSSMEDGGVAGPDAGEGNEVDGNVRNDGQDVPRGGAERVGFVSDGGPAPFLMSSSDFVSPQPRHVDIMPTRLSSRLQVGGSSSSRGRNENAHVAKKRTWSDSLSHRDR